MAKARAKKRAKAATPAPKRRRKAEAANAGGAEPRARKHGVPGTTVVHVDAETYALLQRERRPGDRGYGATLRRLLGMDAGTAEPERETAAV